MRKTHYFPSFLLLSTLPFRNLRGLFGDLLLAALRGLHLSRIPSLNVCGFRLSALGALRTIGGLPARTVVIYHEVLAQGHQVRSDPVHEQPGGEVEEKQGEADGKQSHQPALLRDDNLRRELRGSQYRDGRDNRQEVCGIGDRKVLEPQDAALVEAGVLRGHCLVPEAVTAELADNVEHADKYGHLDYDRETSAEGIDPLLLVDLRHLLPLPLGVVFELRSDSVHVRFQILHGAHASHLFYRQGEEEATHDHRQQHDREPPRRAKRLMEVQKYCAEDAHYGTE